MGAHAQNGVAERFIATVMKPVRTMMLHQALLWLEKFDMQLWPFALTHAAYLWNVIPNGGHRITPIEIYTGTKMGNKIIRSEKTWGYSAYGLDPNLQDGKKLPKWDLLTRQGQYLGKSTKYASSIGLIKNLKTGFISPQFHVIYDHKFETVMGGYEENEAVANHVWSDLTADENVVENTVAHVENSDGLILLQQSIWISLAFECPCRL